MGIETYELLAEVERVFGVVNAYNGKADTFVTVGDLYRYILQKRCRRPPVTCLSATTFYAVRRGVMSAFGVARGQVRPKTSLETLLPLRGRRRAWQELRAAIGLRLPELDPPNRVFLWSFIISLLTWPLCFVAVWYGRDLPSAFFFTVFPGCYPVLFFMVSMSIAMVLSPIHVQVPWGCETVQGLVRATMVETYGEESLKRNSWDDLDVWNDLVTLIEMWGFSREAISETTQFIVDLGAYTL